MTADSKQFGGDHYKGTGYEHWNFVADMQLDYYQACASKYVTRHRSKNGSQDISKSIHFVEKRIELIQQGRISPWTNPCAALAEARAGMVASFVRANSLPIMEAAFVEMVCLPGDDPVSRLNGALSIGQHLLGEYASKVIKEPARQAAEYPSHVAAAMERQFGAEGWWGDGRVLWKCKKCGTYFHGKDGALPSTVHQCATVAAEATPAYVNQDR